MGSKTKIEWTDATWNPVRGCTKVSAGCDNCYAMRQAHRTSGPGGAYEGLTRKIGGRPQWNGQVRIVPELLDQPLRWRRPRRIFVNSMSDLFHPDVPESFIDQVFAVMVLAPQHTFQVLTKRPERMRGYLCDLVDDHLRWERLGDAAGPIFGNAGYEAAYAGWPLPNVWLGVSVEDQATADERIPPLLGTPAAVRFLSCEPVLSSIDLWDSLPDSFCAAHHCLRCGYTPVEGMDKYIRIHGADATCVWCSAPLPNSLIDWVIAGGESGPQARPSHPDWFRSLRDQCVAAGVPFLFKQWGEWRQRDSRTDGVLPRDETLRLTDSGGNGRDLGSHGGNDIWMQRVGKTAAGRRLDGRAWDQYPEPAE